MDDFKTKDNTFESGDEPFAATLTESFVTRITDAISGEAVAGITIIGRAK